VAAVEVEEVADADFLTDLRWVYRNPSRPTRSGQYLIPALGRI